MSVTPGNHNRIGGDSSGDATTWFTGSFQGNGFESRNWRSIDRNAGTVGLFGRVQGDGDGVSDGAIDRLALVDADVEGQGNVGALVGCHEGWLTGSAGGLDISAAGLTQQTIFAAWDFDVVWTSDEDVSAPGFLWAD